MSATYFNKRGDGHSIRGTMAREQGAVAWSKLPATLRRGLSIRDAIDAEISREWKLLPKPLVFHVPMY